MQSLPKIINLLIKSEQIKEFYDTFNKDFDNDKNGKHRGQKEVEVTKGENGIPFVSRINLDYQNRNRIEEMYRKIRGGHGYLDIYKGFWKEEYTYDPNGNITQKRNGWGEIDYQYNQANQLQQAGNRKYQYDSNGNTIREVLGKYKIDYMYNYENRLVKADSQFKRHFCHWPVEGEISFGYDALGRMAKKETNPVYGPKNETETEYYIYNGLGLDILADYKYQTKQYGRYGQKGELDQVNEYYYGNGSLLASKKFDGQGRGHWGWDRDPLKDVSFYHQDILRSVVMLTDKNGQIEERYQYDIWGKVYDGQLKDSFPGNWHSDNIYGFTGQRYQPEIGVYSFPYRDYSPRMMRWLTEDPVKDGVNWYQYCYSNPVNFIDLWGLDPSVLNSETQTTTKSGPGYSQTTTNYNSSILNSDQSTVTHTTRTTETITFTNDVAGQKAADNYTNSINSQFSNAVGTAFTEAGIAATNNPALGMAIGIVSDAIAYSNINVAPTVNAGDTVTATQETTTVTDTSGIPIGSTKTTNNVTVTDNKGKVTYQASNCP